MAAKARQVTELGWADLALVHQACDGQSASRGFFKIFMNKSNLNTKKKGGRQCKEEFTLKRPAMSFRVPISANFFTLEPEAVSLLHAVLLDCHCAR